MTPHAPGPLHAIPVVGTVGDFYVRDSIGPSNLAGVYGRDAEANAILFAAAPDLLAACKRVVAADVNPSGIVLYDDDMKAIEAAIARAEGGA